MRSNLRLVIPNHPQAQSAEDGEESADNRAGAKNRLLVAAPNDKWSG